MEKDNNGRKEWLAFVNLTKYYAIFNANHVVVWDSVTITDHLAGEVTGWTDGAGWYIFRWIGPKRKHREFQQMALEQAKQHGVLLFGREGCDFADRWRPLTQEERIEELLDAKEPVYSRE